jgi:hypothetical protein
MIAAPYAASSTVRSESFDACRPPLHIVVLTTIFQNSA